MDYFTLMDVFYAESHLDKPSQNLLLREVLMFFSSFADQSFEITFGTIVHHYAKIASWLESIMPVMHEALSVLHNERML